MASLIEWMLPWQATRFYKFVSRTQRNYPRRPPGCRGPGDVGLNEVETWNRKQLLVERLSRSVTAFS